MSQAIIVICLAFVIGMVAGTTTPTNNFLLMVGFAFVFAIALMLGMIVSISLGAK